ncbi:MULTISPECIES: hypothetical protein [Rhodococcus erythropolis group]|uniref:Uncharacterized protein n=1 Tax=Rhodococcus erythropolis TaxID=1833 RepID=A0A8I0ZWQ7_RHOER|nr:MULTISPECIES: hypothetical protein [Rhodococcus erythropolis group]MBH5144217.1 hypothetical protein [Rhodococcus erythropolis]MDJ0434673.1 hypothetical protein [Rhodococcus qingshengii]
MASTNEAATRSRRLHTVKNVEQNVKEARQKALAAQQRIEILAKPLNAVSQKLARLERESSSVEAAGERRIESLQEALDKKIEKLKADTAAKIEQTKKDTAAKLTELQKNQQGSEDALALEYAQAVVQFSFGGSNADLATVLGITNKAAKELIASSTEDLEKAGISAKQPTESAAAAAAEKEDPAPAGALPADHEAAAEKPADSPTLASA